MEKVLTGRPVSQAVYQRIASINKKGSIPKLALIRIGDDPASDFYTKNIIKHAQKLNFAIELHNPDKSIEENDLIELIRSLNANTEVNGILIQKPLPKHVNEVTINCLIDPGKDIDGIHPENLGKIFLGIDTFCPCTALSVMEIIKYYNIDTTGKHIVIVGRSPVVAKPLAGLLLRKHKFGNATVTLCHSYTQNIDMITQTADILVAAIGVPEFIKADMIKKNAICIDVGINQVNNKNGVTYVGDIDYMLCYDKALAITPVPGGVGSVTTALLLENLIIATIEQSDKKIY